MSRVDIYVCDNSFLLHLFFHHIFEVGLHTYFNSHSLFEGCTVLYCIIEQLIKHSLLQYKSYQTCLMVSCTCDQRTSWQRYKHPAAPELEPACGNSCFVTPSGRSEELNLELCFHPSSPVATWSRHSESPVRGFQ